MFSNLRALLSGKDKPVNQAQLASAANAGDDSGALVIDLSYLGKDTSRSTLATPGGVQLAAEEVTSKSVDTETARSVKSDKKPRAAAASKAPKKAPAKKSKPKGQISFSKAMGSDWVLPNQLGAPVQGIDFHTEFGSGRPSV